MLQMQTNSIMSASPSFSSYSSSRYAEIASRVIEEMRREEKEKEDDVLVSDAAAHLEQMSLGTLQKEEPCEAEKTSVVEDSEEGNEEEEENENDFEFAFFPRDPDAPAITADEIFANGHIRPTYPIFNRDLLFSESSVSDLCNPELDPSHSFSIPVRNLLTENRNPPSSSPSESDALDEIPSGSYCVWKPKPSSAATSSCCKKSSSTGSSKTWRFLDLLHRSSSNGQDTVVFLSTDAIKGREKKATVPKGEKVAVGVKKGKRELSAHEIYMRNRMMREGDRRRSYLPYRQELVGFFANANGLSRSHSPL